MADRCCDVACCVVCSAVLSSLSVALGTGKSTFSAAVDKTGRIYVEGTVRQNTPYLTKIGGFDVDLSVQGSVLLCRQRDQPGIVGNVGMALAKGNINISFMTVCRTTRNEEAIMAIGIDDEPTKEVSRMKAQHSTAWTTSTWRRDEMQAIAATVCCSLVQWGVYVAWQPARRQVWWVPCCTNVHADCYVLPPLFPAAVQVLEDIGKVPGVRELAVFKELQL